ncbi:phosphatase 2C-like domain-containing protein [Pelagophyceae sp. CCMP2097]|nr:phosphatase 2C-like domain-containing protein [Pelagophyceae sp. CCMP2097]
MSRSGQDGFKGLKERYEDRVGDDFLPGVGHLYAMYDGHGGSNAADWLKAELGGFVASAVKKRIGDTFESQLQQRRLALQRKAADSARSSGKAPRLTEAVRTQLRDIEACAIEADAALAELRALSYAPPPELVDVRDALADRRKWLDTASRKRKGGRDASSALQAALAERATAEAAALKASEAAGKSATVDVSDELWKLSLDDAFRAADDAFLELAAKKAWDDGTTACCAIVVGDGQSSVPTKIVMANCGDSRAILCRGRRGLRLSTDHKPNNPVEKRRIEKLGGYVVEVNGVWRVTSAAGCGFGMSKNKSLYLSVARAVGDRQLKHPTPVVTCAPEVKVHSLDSLSDFFLVLVCDGITDVLDDTAVVAIAAQHFGDPNEAARQVVRAAFTKGAADNVTALVVEFPWATSATVSKAFAAADEDSAPPKKEAADAVDMFA